MLIGRCGTDPEIKEVGDTTVAKIPFATSETWKDKKTGEKQEKTQWHTLEIWGVQAKIIEEYVKKGDLLHVEGSVEYTKYEPEGKEAKWFTKINVRAFKMLGGSSSPGEAQKEPEPITAQPDDLPF